MEAAIFSIFPNGGKQVVVIFDHLEVRKLFNLIIRGTEKYSLVFLTQHIGIIIGITRIRNRELE